MIQKYVFLFLISLVCFNSSLEAKEVDVMSLEASDARPIPEAVLRHQGDHFNRTLFVVSGLDSQPDDSTLFSRMNQYVEHYAKVATWVLFVVPDARTLVRFAQQKRFYCRAPPINQCLPKLFFPHRPW